MRSDKCKEDVFESFFLCIVCVWKLAPDEHTQDVNNAVCPRRHSQNRERLDKCKEGVFESFCLLMKACSSGWSNLEHVSPNVGALLRLLVEVCWKWLGLWGLDQGYVEGFAAVMLFVLRPRWSTWLLFLCRLTWAGGLLRSVRKTPWKQWKNKVPQVYERWFWVFVLLRMKACSSGWSNFVPIFGDLGTFLGYFFHIGPFHSNYGTLLRLLVEVCWKHS